MIIHMKKIVKHAISFLCILIALYALISFVLALPCSDTIKGAILLVSLILGIVGDIIFRIKRGCKPQNKECLYD